MANAARAITMIVPYVAGGGSDQRARLVARHLSRHLGRPIEVVNRTGAIVGHTAIAEAAPDGETIGLVTGEVGMMHWHAGLTTLGPDDYTALACPFVESAAVIVAAGAPWSTLDHFLSTCATLPVRGSGGPNFSVWKFALAGLFDRAGIEPGRIEWIETLSGEQGLENVLAGKAHVAPITMTDARGPLRAGKARALATMEDVRHPVFTDVPTVREAVGVDWSVAHWRGVVGPAGMPEDVRARYVEALAAVARDPAFRMEAEASAFTVRWRLGDDFTRYMAEDDERFGRIITLLATDGTSDLH
jgi:tripartite-type tricarboxylate transporter receptor subunit TctC